MLVIALDIGHSLWLVGRSHGKFSRLALPAKTSEDEEGAAESSDEDKCDGNSGYSSRTNTVGAIVGDLDDSSTARGRIGGCGTNRVGMRYGNDLTWHRWVKSCLGDREVGLFVVNDQESTNHQLSTLAGLLRDDLRFLKKCPAQCGLLVVTTL